MIAAAVAVAAAVVAAVVVAAAVAVARASTAFLHCQRETVFAFAHLESARFFFYRVSEDFAPDLICRILCFVQFGLDPSYCLHPG